jgi:uncharacterized protein YndB with AHSA1/START domain
MRERTEASKGLPAEGQSYAAELAISAPARQVYAALTTLDGIAGWWTSEVSGPAGAGGHLKLGFVGTDEHVTMEVRSTAPDRAVVWRCLEHTGHPEWKSTTITFTLREAERAKTTLLVEHLGLVPALGCSEQCFLSWQHFTESIRRYVEQGEGRPFERRFE